MTIADAGTSQHAEGRRGGGLDPRVHGRPAPPGGPDPIAHEWPRAQAAPVTGPARPRPGRHAHLPAGTAPARPQAGRAARRPVRLAVMCVGAHGGAGTTTLARLLRLELASAWPAGSVPHVHDKGTVPDAQLSVITGMGLLPAPPPGMPLMVAARGNAEGSRRAVIVLAALHQRGIRPVALAVVADGAGPEPRQAVQRFALITGHPDRCGPVVRIPFAAGLRAGTIRDPGQLPRRLRQAAAELTALAALMPPGGR